MVERDNITYPEFWVFDSLEIDLQLKEKQIQLIQWVQIILFKSLEMLLNISKKKKKRKNLSHLSVLIKSEIKMNEI